MSLILNSNRYVCAIVKTGVTDFTRFSGSSVRYLLRDQQGELFVKRGFEPVQTVTFPSQAGKLNRVFAGEKLSLSETSSDLPVVNVIGYNPYQMYKSEFNCAYYSYFDAGTWKTAGLESHISDVFPSFAIAVVVGSGDKFLVMQIGDDVCVYAVGLSSLTKKSQLENFTLVDAMSSSDDIALLLVKRSTFYPSQGVYETSLGETVVYYKNSPVVFLCTSSSGYSEFSSFCQPRSVFPVLCSPEDVANDSSFFLYDSKFYVASLGYDASLDAFVPVTAVGRSSDSWRYFDPTRPFSTTVGITEPQICVDSNDITYVAGKKNGEVFLAYYNVQSKKWSNYDSASALTFEGAKISSSSSSRSSSSCSCSSSSCSCSSCSCSSSSCSCSSCSCSSSSCSCSSCSCSSSSCSSSSCSCSSCSSSSCSCSSSSCSCSSSSCSCSSSSLDGNFFKISVETTLPNQSFSVSLTNPNDLYVDWGDFTHNTYTLVGSATYTHYYTNSGTYKISISGSADNMRFTGSRLKSIVNPLDSVTGLISAESMFQNCTSLTAILPGLFDSCVGITSFVNTFNGCTSLASIPSGLFDNNTLVTSFAGTFLSCYGVATIPSGLFDNNTLVTDFYQTFGNCSGLTTIPSGLFDNNTLVTSFSTTFSTCFNITSIPSSLFANNTLVTSFNRTFASLTSLLAIPAGLFDNNVLVTDFGLAFYRNYQITSIPSGLFTNNTAVTSFSQTFMECEGLSSIPSNLFDYNTAATVFLGTFYGCTSLTSIPSGLLDNNVYAEHFMQMFMACTSLVTIPSTLFDNTVLVTDLEQCFDDCSSVTSNVPALWVDYPSADHAYCFHGCVLAANYASIPDDWKGI